MKFLKGRKLNVGIVLCPICESEAGVKIREALFGSDFFLNLAACFTPFIIFSVIIFLLHGKKSKF
jgi:hypothetical protein